MLDDQVPELELEVTWLVAVVLVVLVGREYLLVTGLS